MSTIRSAAAGGAFAALWITGAIAAGTQAGAAANPPGAMPGDEAMSCEQIYAAGMAEAQRDQQERSEKRQQMKAQGEAFKGMLIGATAVGGLFGTGQAVQATVEAGADRQMAMMSAPQSNPRMDRVKQLWAEKHCVKK
jgi:hypothetical protein